MRQDALHRRDVLFVLEQGMVVEEIHHQGRPYPTRIYFARVNEAPIHVVCGVVDDENLLIVTVYECDTDLWDETFTTRR